MLLGKSVLCSAQNNPLTRFTVKTVILDSGYIFPKIKGVQNSYNP
jgi:hypothetical protein